MKNFEKAMIGLDLTAMDEVLIHKVSTISKMMGFKKLYFVHVSKDLSLPEDIRKQYPDLFAPIDETIKAEIKGLIKEKAFAKSIEIEVLVKEGNPHETLLRWAKIKDVDLIIMGRKTELDGSGTLAKDMAHQAPCSVLFLTESATFEIPKKVLIALDFSEHSHLTVEFAERLADEFSAEILGLHIYEIPSGYYKTGKSHEEFAEIMEGHARKDFDRFLKKYHHNPFECLFKMKKNGNSGRFVIEESKKAGADMILIGSRGRTASAAVLLGSLAEKTVQVNNQLPMLIFKKKNETMTLLQALLKI